LSLVPIGLANSEIALLLEGFRIPQRVCGSAGPKILIRQSKWMRYGDRQNSETFGWLENLTRVGRSGRVRALGLEVPWTRHRSIGTRSSSQVTSIRIFRRMRQLFEVHLFHCPRCASLIDWIRNILVLISEVRTFPLSASVSACTCVYDESSKPRNSRIGTLWRARPHRRSPPKKPETYSGLRILMQRTEYLRRGVQALPNRVGAGVFYGSIRGENTVFLSRRDGV
jgi:hypothetical protein